MPEATQETPAVERPSFGDAYESLTYNDDQAIEAEFGGASSDDLFETLETGAATFKDLLLIVRVCEFVRYLHDGTPQTDAAAAAKALTKGALGELMNAYMAHEPEADQTDPDTPAGKGDSDAA